MDDSVIRAMVKWPNAPAVFGWLALDRQGQWRLKGALIKHKRTVGFINRNYACDRTGRWHFQNGPQRVFVDLAFTPWIYRLAGDDALTTHTGEPAPSVESAWLTEDADLLLVSERGAGAVDDAALFALSDRIRGLDGRPMDEAALERAILDAEPRADIGVRLMWRGERTPVGFMPKRLVPERFGFVPRPRPD